MATNDIINKLKISKQDFQNSADWFMSELEGINANDTRRKILKLQSRSTKYFVAGRMYLFAYSAKNQATLPKWDMFPLIFPVSKCKGGFLGINLHYVPVGLRIEIINQLLGFANNKSMSANTRIVAQWNMIKTLSRSKNLGIEECIKMYLNDHVRSSFIEIPPTSWHKTATLQLERFVYKRK